METADGTLNDPDLHRAVAIIDIADDTSSYNLPGGSAAQVALYMPYAHHFAIIANADLAELRIYGRTLILRWIKVLQDAEARGNRQDL